MNNLFIPQKYSIHNSTQQQSQKQSQKYSQKYGAKTKKTQDSKITKYKTNTRIVLIEKTHAWAILNYYKMQVQALLERIGIGPTHIWMMIALSLIEVINGYKIVMISLISPHLKEQWALKEEVKNIPLAFYCGIILGSLMAGSLANFSGRKYTLFIGQIFQVLGSIAMVYSNQFITFLLTLIVGGTGFGISLIMANTLLTEQMPQKYRGKSLLFISFIAILGKFFAIIAAYMFELKNWRNPEIGVAISGGVLSLVILLKIPESFRVLLLNGQFQESEKLFCKLLKEQNKPQMTGAQKQIMKEISSKNAKNTHVKTKFQQIFYKNALKTTIMMSISWFTINFMFYGQLFIMPFMFENKQSSTFTQFTQMISGQVPSILLTFNMIEREKLGRKNSIAIFFFIAALLNFSLIYIQSVFIISLSRLAMKSVLQILYPFTTESYSTSLRSSGLAFCSGIGRIGSIIMPMLVYPIYQIDPYLVFVAFMVTSMIGLYSTLSTHQTLHHSLDNFQFQLPHQEISILPKADMNFSDERKPHQRTFTNL